MIAGAGSGLADAWGLVAVMVEIGVNAMTDVTTGLSTPSVTSTFRSAMGGPGWWNARLLASVMSLGSESRFCTDGPGGVGRGTVLR